MFIGIIEATAEVRAAGDGRLTLARPVSFDDLRIGASVSVAGVCLSVAELAADVMTFDLVPETLARTRLGALRPGARLNLERAVRGNGRLDGHVVQGHVEGVAEVLWIKEEGRGKRLAVRLPEELRPFAVAKSSIALDGVSLTIAVAERGAIEVALIPLTLRETTLAASLPGDGLNVETDVLLRAPARRVQKRQKH